MLPLILQPQSAFGLPPKGQQLTVVPNTLSPSHKSPAFRPVIFVSPLPTVLPQTLSQFCIIGFFTCSTLLSVCVQNFTSAVSYKGPNERCFFFKSVLIFTWSLQFSWPHAVNLRSQDGLFHIQPYMWVPGRRTRKWKFKKGNKCSFFKELSWKCHIISTFLKLPYCRATNKDSPYREPGNKSF